MVPCILHAHPTQSDARRRYGAALGVEIRHDDFEAPAFLVQEARDGHLHVLECDEGASGCANSGIIHRPAVHALCGERDDQEGYARGARTTGADSSRYVVCPDGIGDPFFRAVDNVVVSISNGSSFDIGDVGTS